MKKASSVRGLMLFGWSKGKDRVSAQQYNLLWQSLAANRGARQTKAIKKDDKKWQKDDVIIRSQTCKSKDQKGIKSEWFDVVWVDKVQREGTFATKQTYCMTRYALPKTRQE